MLALRALLACEKVIFEKEHGTPSLISVLQRIIFQAAEDVPDALPKDAMAPITWHIFTIWTHDGKEDIGKKFVQQAQLESSDGEMLPVKATLPFTTEEDFSINSVRIIGFPVGYSKVNIKVWLESETGEVLSPESVYPIRVERLIPTK